MRYTFLRSTNSRIILKRKSMTQKETLSLPAAIFININVMLGTGTFINTVLLAQHTGALGGFLYPLAGLLVLPLILCMAELTGMYSEGNFYHFGASMSPYWGFLCSWGYFVGKLASVALSVHVFVVFLKHIFPILSLSSFLIEAAIIAIFTLLNMLNVQTGSKIQYGFVVMKALPLLFAIFAGLSCCSLINVSSPTYIWKGIPIALPLVLFCVMGFEATCSLSKVIKNSKRNAPRAILISFSIVIFLSTLYQFLFYSSVGDALGQQASYINAFPLLIELATPYFSGTLDAILSIAIAVSALGGAYGILYSNHWNLYALAKEKQTFFWRTMKKLNSYQIPFWCVLAEGLICIGYLILTKGNQIPLQYTTALACITSYSISTVSFFYQKRSLLGALGIAVCMLLLGFCVNGFIHTSLIPLYLFGTILLAGSLMYRAQTT